MKMLLTLFGFFCFCFSASAADLIANATINGVKLNLAVMADERVSTYEIYRSDVHESEYSLITTIPARKYTPGPQRYEYTDQDVKAGVTYYYYYVEVSTRNSRRSHRAELASATSERDILPDSYTLSAYPNPFNPSTVVKFNLMEAGDVQVKVYDISGRLVTDLVEGSLPAGEHRIAFDGENLPSGLYVARMESRGFSASQNLMLMK